MLRFLQQLPRALRQQWNVSVRTSQAIQSEEDGLDRASRVFVSVDNSLSHSSEGKRSVEKLSIVKNECQTGANEDRRLQTCFQNKFYQRAYSHVPYTCREALGWGSALVIGLQFLHLWKSGWFGKESSQNVRRRRERECLVKSLYRLAMAMPQSSGIARHVIKPNKDHTKTETAEKITDKEEHTPTQTDEKLPTLDEAVDSWKRFSDKYIALTLTLEGVEHAKQGSLAKAIKLWERASKSGLDKAHYNLAVCYENGHGVEKNMLKAVEYYEEAAKRGHASSLFNLAMLHFSGDECVSQDKDLAVHLLHQAAVQGLPQAQRELGVLYTEEEMKDMKRACELFEQAAAQEDIDAVYYLGICYEQGWGAEKNECKAADLYTKASRAGHEGALYNLATFFEDGKGGLPEDKTAALELFQQAWKNGNPGAKEEICRLNSLLLNRKLGDELNSELNGSSDKAMRHSSSQPTFTENGSRNLNLFEEIDLGVGKEIIRSDDEIKMESTPSVSFTIGDFSEENQQLVFTERNKQITCALEFEKSEKGDKRQLQEVFTHRGHLDLDIMDTCRRSMSMNDLVYRSPCDLSLQTTSNLSGPQNLQMSNVRAQAAGILLCS